MFQNEENPFECFNSEVMGADIYIDGSPSAVYGNGYVSDMKNSKKSVLDVPVEPVPAEQRTPNFSEQTKQSDIIDMLLTKETMIAICVVVIVIAIMMSRS